MRYKRSIALLMSVLLMFTCMSALASDARVFDGADLFSGSEEAELGQLIAEFQAETAWILL